MPGRYHRIDLGIWRDDKFARLSAAKPNAQTLWVWLICGPFSTPFGLVRCGKRTMSEEIGWNFRQFKRCFQEILDLGMAKYDEQTRVLWIPKMIRYQPLLTLNQLITWARLFSEIPDCLLKVECYKAIRERAERLGKQFPQRFAELFSQPLSEPKGYNLTYNQPNPTYNGLAPSVGGNSSDKKLAPEELVELYNEICVPLGLPTMLLPLSEDVSAKVQQRLCEYPDAEFWRSTLDRIRRSPCLRGEGDWPGANFDWLVATKDNPRKVFAGNYQRNTKRQDVDYPEL